MISLGPSKPGNKAVPQTQSIILRLLISGGGGLALLVVGIQRIRDFGAVTPAGVAMPLVGLFLLVVGVFLARDLPAARKLDTHGEITAGKIISRWTRTDSDDDKKCYLAYKYNEDQQSFQAVGWKHYQQVAIGEVVEVRYLPEDPTLSRLEGEWYR